MTRLLVILFILASCNSKHYSEYIDIVNKAERIQIVFSSDAYKDTTIELTKNLKRDIQNVFEGKDEKCFCVPTGRLRFYSNNEVILVTDFSIDKVDNSNDEDCVFLSVYPSEHGCYRLNYNIGMFLSERYSDLKRIK